MSPHVFTLLFVTAVWGATFPIMKLATEQLSGIDISALRFVVATVVMAPFAVRASRAAWRDGAILGAVALVSYVAQAWGLQTISSNRSAFLTSLNVLMVPMLGLVWGARPGKIVWIAASLALAGIGLMSWEGGADLAADSATVVSALAYALYIVLLGQRTRKHSSVQLVATQVIWMALLGVGWMVLQRGGLGAAWTVVADLRAQTVWGLLYLGVIATAGMLFLQAVAQRHVSANKAALIYAMEPVFAAVFAWWWLSEVLTLRAALGGALVVGAVVLSELKSTESVAS